MLANVYLHRLDREWQTPGQGVLCRYADDLVVMCLSQWQARNGLATLREILAEIGLKSNDAKTQVVHLRAGGGSFDFLGFEHRSMHAQKSRGGSDQLTNIDSYSRCPYVFGPSEQAGEPVCGSRTGCREGDANGKHKLLSLVA